LHKNKLPKNDYHSLQTECFLSALILKLLMLVFLHVVLFEHFTQLLRVIFMRVVGLDNIGLVTFWFLREHTIEDLGNLIFCDASREKPVQNNGGWRAQSIACLHLALVLRLAGSVAKTHRMPKFAGHVSPKGPFGAKRATNYSALLPQRGL